MEFTLSCRSDKIDSVSNREHHYSENGGNLSRGMAARKWSLILWPRACTTCATLHIVSMQCKTQQRLLKRLCIAHELDLSSFESGEDEVANVLSKMVPHPRLWSV